MAELSALQPVGKLQAVTQCTAQENDTLLLSFVKLERRMFCNM